MSPLGALVKAGLRVGVDEQQRVVLSPRSKVTDEIRALVRANKNAILAELDSAHHLAARLVSAINACCDLRGDDDCDRAALIAESHEQTPEAQADLVEHFREQAAIWARVTGKAIP